MAAQQQAAVAAGVEAPLIEVRVAQPEPVEVGVAGLTAEELAAGASALDSDLAYILEDSGVEARHRGYL